ncbi:RNA polymerase sigma factor [Pedobacter cryophilus]|uniref:RNA polymerase sigma-70 factor n=1 Tax=Pedobacter cryophilus TaxID=2571271 RepID=A0A4U1C8B9_9SPHI|nr:RNA polymerase sigma-70 factor [Pedobacter cryophilus]TKC00934.1 RNA polymerase sigma-70 factor [Pedobacter cryophilus]
MQQESTNICNPKVFETIFRTYAKEVKRFVFFKTRDMDAAEDIVQDVFVKLWGNCSEVAFNSVKGFLFTIANNLFLNTVVHKKVVEKHQQEFSKEGTSESPEFIFLEQEFLVKLETAIGDLPAKQREVFLLSRLERKKYKEISELLGISVKAVEKRMHLALLVLREKIGNV